MTRAFPVIFGVFGLASAVLLCPFSASGWGIWDEDGHCCTQTVLFQINDSSFRDTSFELANFPDCYSVRDQVCAAANYWNDCGQKMRLVRTGDTTQCKTDEDVCSLPKDDPIFGGANEDYNQILGVAHWTRGSCVSWGCGEIAIQSWYIVMNGDVPWKNYYGDNGVSFIEVMAHEFGHTLALLDNKTEYNEIKMSYGLSQSPWPGHDITLITEDDCFGLSHAHGRDQEPLRFRTAKMNDSGLYDFSPSDQIFSGNGYESLGLPAIAINPDSSSSRTFDFAVAWTRSSDRALSYELIKMTSEDSHAVVEGPVSFPPAYASWQGPSVAVNSDGAVGMAYRYEKENPNPDDRDELIRNTMIRLLVSNSSRSVYYNVEPATCAEGRCRTINTPAFTFDWGAQRWLIAFTENVGADDVPGSQIANTKQSISVLVSDDSTGLTWSRPPLRTGYHSAWASPAINCDSFWGFGQCLLVYPSYDRPDGRIAKIHQAVIEIDNSAPSGLALVSGGAFDLTSSRYAHLGLAGSNYGWLLTGINTPSAQYDSLAWNHKNWTQGLSGSWTSIGDWVGPVAEKGFSVACNYFAAIDEVLCRFVWTLH